MRLVPVTNENRDEANRFISERWNGLIMAVRAGSSI